MNRIRRAACAALLGLVLGAAGCRTVGEPLADLADPADVHEKGDAILIEDEHVTFERGDDGSPVARVYEHRQGVVMDERGQWLRAMGAAYDTTFSSVDDVLIRTRAPDGTQRSWDRATARDVPAYPGFVLYSDNRNLDVVPPLVAPGTVVDAWVARRVRSPELFSFGWSFGAAVPAHVSRFTLSYPQGWSVEIRTERMGKPRKLAPVSTATVDGVVTTVWEEKDVPGRRGFRRGLSAGAQGDRVLLRLATWTDGNGTARHGPADAPSLSRYAFGLGKDRAVAAAGVKAAVSEALRGVADDPRAKAAHLYAWARDHIQYCSVDVGIGGWVPHAADQVEKLRYGDCKDKANLLRTMLHVAGIESRAATIYASEWPEPFRFPVLGDNFNHAIVIVDLPKGPVFADPTSPVAAFGELPELDEDRMLLPLSEAGSPLVATPKSSADDNVRDESYDLVLGADGRARGTLREELTGAYAQELRGLLLLTPPKRHEDVIADDVLARGPKVTGVELENQAPPLEPAPMRVKAAVAIPLVRGGVVDVTALRGARIVGAAFPAVEEELVGPFLLGYRRREHVVVKLHLPAGAAVLGTLPPPASFDDAFATYRSQWSVAADGALVFERSTSVKERLVPGKRVPELRKLFDDAGIADDVAITITPPPPEAK